MACSVRRDKIGLKYKRRSAKLETSKWPLFDDSSAAEIVLTAGIVRSRIDKTI